MFLDEARINARLTHSNIVQVLELGQVEGKYFMAMEFVPGLSVSQVGKRATKTPRRRAAGGGVRHRDASVQRAALRARQDDARRHAAQHHPPRRVAAEPDPHLRGAGQGARLRHRQGRSPRVADAHGPGQGQVLVHVARAVPGAGARPAQRRLRARHRALRAVHRAAAVQARLDLSRRTRRSPTADVPPPRRSTPRCRRRSRRSSCARCAKKPDDRYPTADAMQDALEEAMHKSGLRGSATDLAQAS